DLPHRQPQQPGDDGDRGHDGDDDGRPPRDAVAQQERECGPQQGGDQDGDQQRDDEELELDDEPDPHADRRGHDQQPPGVGGGHPQPARQRRADLGVDRAPAAAQRVEEGPAGRVIGVGHPASLFPAHACGRIPPSPTSEGRASVTRVRETLSRGEARRVALAAQGLAASRPDSPGTRQLNQAMARMGVLQIDSVNVFARSHYLPLFSRLGPYDTAVLDRLLFARRPAYVESWAHVAAFIPVADWALFQFRRDDLVAKYGDGEWMQRHAEIVDWVRAELAARGPLRPAEIDHDAKKRGGRPWWDWDVIKEALERLFLFGEVAIAGRRGFERRYGL